MNFFFLVISVFSLFWLNSCSVTGAGSGTVELPLVQGQAACYGSTSGGSFVTPATVGSPINNTMTITIGGSGVCGRVANAPCTSVTICQHGSTTTCQTIDNILLDTGSYGLRVFSSAMSSTLCNSLTPITDGTNPIGECQPFGTGATWGPVMKADLQLAGEPIIQLPIQIINASFSYMPSACADLQYDSSPSDSDFNGILGVGLFGADCGTNCQSLGNNQYFACTATSCGDASVLTANQVQNPIPLYSTTSSPDYKGVVLDVPALTGGAASSWSGSVYLGIGTQANNTPGASVVAYQAKSLNMAGTFKSAYSNGSFSSGSLTGSFIDSGSNCLFFSPPAANWNCTESSVEGFLCPPSSPSTSAATMTGSDNLATTPSFNFIIADAYNLYNTNQAAMQYLGASTTGLPFTNFFDWGFPFFYGRKVWVGTSGQAYTFNAGSKTGPYWAF